MRNLAKKRLGSRLGRGLSRTPFATNSTTQNPTPPTKVSGGGSGSPQNSSSVDYELAPWQPTATEPFDLKKAAHLMRRAGFGASPEQLEAIVNIGHAATIDLLVIPSNWGIQEYGSVMLPSGEVLNIHSSVADQRGQWVYEMVNSHFPLKEKMALFLHDHFSVGANSSSVYPMMVPHINIFRRHGLGKMRDVLIEVSRDPAMLWWLDNRINGAGGKINENYGREVLELYTMGVDNGYTQADVVETSKCFAGWSLYNYNRFRYNTNYAKAGYGWKVVLGRYVWSPTQEQEGYILIDLLLDQKQTSEYLTSKIWSYFVTERPAQPGTEQTLWDGIIVELAKRWKSSGYDLRALMWVILSCNHFYQKAPRQLVKNPAEALAGAIRNLGLPFIGRYNLLGSRIEAMGLPLFRYTNPAGLDDGIAWIDSQALINRSNFYDELTQTSTTADFRVKWDPMAEVQRKALTKSKEIVDHFLEILVDGDVPTAVRTNLYDFMDKYDTLGTIPYDGLLAQDPRRISKIRGLVHLIMILPEYQIN